MAAIVENAENGQIGNDLAYCQSSKSDGIHSAENVSDSSNTLTKVADFVSGQKVNGLSHMDKTPQLQKTDANTQGPGAVKIDAQQYVVNSGVTKTENDLREKSKVKEVIAAEMHHHHDLNQSMQDTNSLPPVGSTICVKDEEKVKLKVPFDPKSSSCLSLENAESKSSSCNADEVKDSLVSLQTSGKESQDEIKSEIQECKVTEPFSLSENSNNEENPLISANKIPTIASTLEDKDLQSNFNDKKLCKPVENISINTNNMDNVYLPGKKTTTSKSAADCNANSEKDSANITPVADEKLAEKNNYTNCSENFKSLTFSDFLPASKADKKNSGASNIPELLAHCSPCRVVVQDFFKELNIDLLELSRNFPVQHAHKKRLNKSKSVQGVAPGGEQIKNKSLNRTKQAKCYTENSKRRKKQLSEEDLNRLTETEDTEENLPLLSIRNNLNQSGNTAEDTIKPDIGEGKSFDSGENKTTADEENLRTKGGNSHEIVIKESRLTNSTSSNVSMATSTNSDSADPFQKMSVINVSPTVDLNESNDLGLKIVSVSSQGSVFFPAFTNNKTSEKIVFTQLDSASKLNGQLESTSKLSAPKCKFHGTNSSPGQNLYKCKKCGLKAKSLSDIQSHMAGSHSEFCMYRCPFCVPSLPVKRVSLYNSRPIEFEVLQESSQKLVVTAPSSTTSAKRKMPRHIQIQREKRRKLNYYYRNQREIKMYKNEKVSCEYCHKQINQSNISRHQNSKICLNPAKMKGELSLMIKDKIPKKYQKVKCDSCRKRISRTNMSKHSRICPRENDA